MITMDKKYQTRTGQPVRILCLDGPSATYPIIAIADGRVATYTRHGKFMSSDSPDKLDLVETPKSYWKPITRRNTNIAPANSREAAMAKADGEVVALLEIISDENQLYTSNIIVHKIGE